MSMNIPQTAMYCGVELESGFIPRAIFHLTSISHLSAICAARGTAFISVMSFEQLRDSLRYCHYQYVLIVPL